MGNNANLSEIYPKLYPADIGAVKGSGPLLWLSKNLLVPHTDRVHFFLVGDYIPWDDDYVIMESIGKGIAVGRLSFYKPEDIEIYRVNLSTDSRLLTANSLLRRQVAAEMTLIGRARYDFVLYLQLFAGAATLMLQGKFPPYRAEQLPYGRNKDYICTEAANFGWRARGHPIIPPGVVPTPSEYKQALIDKKIRVVFPKHSNHSP